jgi:NTE family protein
MGFFSRLKQLFHKKQQPQLKLGLALGSGGAKGLAHLGMLRAFEEEGISFQVVTGTSIGSIIGALYAKGYTSSDMVEIIRNFNLRELSKNLRPMGDMGFAEELLEEYLEGDISDLPIPFAAWATDADTNEGVLLNEGKTARLVTASSAIPPLFRPVSVGDKRLADGAFTNAIPADVCKQMGADFVIGCDLSAFNPPPEERGMLVRLLGSAVGSFVSVHYTEDCKTRGYEATDLMIRPDLRDYRATDATREAMDEMYELGYQETKSRMEEIKTALKEAGFVHP